MTDDRHETSQDRAEGASARPRGLPGWLPDWMLHVLGILVRAERYLPYALAGLVFAGGLVLMVSAVQPVGDVREKVLRDLLPLPFAEASHLSASLAGLALIILSRGLALRVAQARVTSMIVLLAGAAFAVAKGLHWEEAGLLLVLALALHLSRDAFYRRGDWRSFRPGAGWMVLAALAVVAVILTGFLGYRHVEYRTELWWQFAWHGDAPRFLRASLAISVALAALTLDALINRPVVPHTRAGEAVPEAVRRILDDWPDTAAQAAYIGDKRFLVSPDGRAFLMYAVSGRSWVSLCGPIGDPIAGEPLIWAFAEEADRQGGRPVFYNIGPDRVAQLLDLGQAIVKFGETARVDLTDFSLEGSARKGLRYARTRAQRDGLAFEVIPRADLAAIAEDLQAVSDAWLAGRGGREKGFSLGRFDPAYLAEFDIAVMRHEGRIVAFANILRGGSVEMSIDLMRHLPDQSPVLMEAFIVELLLLGQAEGYLWFNLGGAPLSGLKNHPLAPLWSRIGTVIYRRGDDFYSFEGLRAFKQKFGPVWTPRYLTCPGGLSMARAMFDVAVLISRPRKPG